MLPPVPTVSLPALISAGGGGGTNIDNEIFGTSALWEQTPHSLLSLPREGAGGLSARWDHWPPACPSLWVSDRGRCPDLLPRRLRHAVCSPRHASRLVTDR